MTIRRIAILAVALAALSACKAVTLQEATVTQPTFGIEAEDWGVPATNELRQTGRPERYAGGAGPRPFPPSGAPPRRDAGARGAATLALRAP